MFVTGYVSDPKHMCVILSDNFIQRNCTFTVLYRHNTHGVTLDKVMIIHGLFF